MMFWDYVKIEIRHQNTTYDWVANKSGIDPGTFRSAISKKNEPLIGRAYAIAQALGVSVEYLVTGKHPAWMAPKRLAGLCDDLILLSDGELQTVGAMVKGLAVRHRASGREEGAG